MPTITATGADGATQTITAEEGGSLMEALRDSGVAGILALCGGCCACATCHVHIEGGAAGELSPMSEDEDALLDDATDRTPASRLSCQIAFDASVDGLALTVPPA